MNPRSNAVTQAVLAEIEAGGFGQGRITHKGKHLNVSWHMNGEEYNYTLPCTPSDVRGALNARADVRRMIKAAADTSSEIEPFRPRLVALDGYVLASSRTIAEAFDKRHDNVLRDIDNILKDIDSSDLRSRLFRPTMEADAQGIQRRSYQVTRDGFSLLAMGFTGAKAMRFKLGFIEAFNAMEGALRRAPADNTALTEQVARLSGDLDALVDLISSPPPARPKRVQFIRPSKLRRLAAQKRRAA